MNKFLKRVILFCSPLLILLLFFEIFLRNINTLYLEKKNGLLSQGDSIQLLILGNSHGAMDINPDKFDMYAYNMAQVNQSLYFDKRITLKYLDKLPNLKLVLINLDFHSLYFSSEGYMDTWTYYAYGINYKNEIPLLSKVSYVYGYTPKMSFEFLKRVYTTRNTPIGRHLVDINKGQYNNTNIEKGWLPFVETDTANMNANAYSERAKSFNETVEKNAGEKSQVIADLEDFIILLKSKNITPVFITTPCYPGFKKLLDKNIMPQNKIDIDSLCEKYNIKYFNFYDEPFNEEEYHDCDHLNKTGANRFSKMINDKLKIEFAGYYK